MKGKVILALLLFLIMFLIPFLSMGAKLQDKTGTASQPQSHITVPQVQSGSAFKIRDTTSGKIITADDRSFLYGAIAAEMSPSAPQEALKAQGVAAYTYYSRLREQQKQKSSAATLNGADFSADTQNWKIFVTKEQMQARWGSNFESYYNKLTPIVDAIYGQVLKSDGELIDATYYAISAGQTETSEDIWGGKRSYLVSVASPGDAFAGGYQTTVTLTTDQFKTAVLKSAPTATLNGDASSWIGASKRTAAGSVENILIGGATMTGDAARSAFGLRSANFTVSYANGSFLFLVKGYGHGVGMSQTGAEYMANQGQNYKQILAWYYPTTTLTKIST